MFKSKKTKKLQLLCPGEYLRSVLDDAGLNANRQPSDGNPQWATRDHGRHGHEIGTLLRHIGPNVAEPAGEVFTG